MPYFNITFDVGAAVNALEFLWSHQEMFANVIYYLKVISKEILVNFRERTFFFFRINNCLELHKELIS